MAGGSANQLDRPFPDGLLCIQSAASGTIPASQTDYIWDELVAPFSFRVHKAEVVEAGGSTDADASRFYNVIDDTGTPKVVISDTNGDPGAATTAGAAAAKALTVDPKVVILAGAKVKFQATTGANDEIIAATIRLWVEPLY